MNEMQIFSNPAFGQVRIITDNASKELLFCANDVTDALGYSNGRKAVADHVEKDDVTKRDITDNLGRTQSATFINESGVYSLIFGSKQERAKEFKRWVTSEILPSIRKTGQYIIAQPSLNDKLQVNLTFADWTIKTLNLNEASKICWAKKIAEKFDIPTDALPSGVNAGTDHPTMHSATELLKIHKMDTSVQLFNKVLECRGIVKTATRPGKGGKVHSWKVLQPEYDKYGQNVQDPKFQNQTQIKWYDNLFGELLFSLGVKKELAFNI